MTIVLSAPPACPWVLRHDLRPRMWRSSIGAGSRAPQRPAAGQASRRLPPVRVTALLRPGAAWWKVPKPANMTAVNSVQQLVNELDAHKDGLVVVEFFGTWCGGCKALLPHVIRLAEEDPSIHWVTVDYDENKPLGRGLGVKGLPSFLIFDGVQGCVEELSVTAGRLSQLTDALERHRRPSGSCPPGPIQIPPLPAFPTVRPRKVPAAEQQQQKQQQQQQQQQQAPPPLADAAGAAPQQVRDTLSNVVELPSAFAREAAPAECS
ncbi:hypothetical protein ABPG75_008621 [Micractinium tetrahymenae]